MQITGANLFMWSVCDKWCFDQESVFCVLTNAKARSGRGAQLGLTPPPGIWRGYPTFVISILFIGGNTAIIGDVAGHLGCFIYLKDGVNAIMFVALGTSVPGRLGPGRPARSNTCACDVWHSTSQQTL